MSPRPAVLVVLAAALAAVAAAAPAETRIADIREITNLTFARAPDGGSIVVTLLGGLWRVPGTGGAATELTPSGQGADHPRFDPAGRRIVYERLVDGQWDLWLYDTAAGEARALTRTPYDERHPDFSADGESVVFAADRAGRFRLWRLPAAGGTPVAISNVRGVQSFPTVSDQGVIAYVSRTEDRWSLRAIAPSGADLELYSSEHALAAPSWRPGGGVILFSEIARAAPSVRLNMIVLSDQRLVRTLVTGEDVFVGRPAWESPARYLYAADGRLWRRGIAALDREPVPALAAAQVDGIDITPVQVRPDAPGPHAVAGFGEPAYAADGDFGVVTALGDVWRFDARRRERLTDDAGVEIDPAVLPDGRSIIYASDRGGAMSLWQLTLDEGRPRRLTFDDAKAFSPVPGPEGRYVAYLTTDGLSRTADAELRVLALGTSAAPRVLASGLANARELGWARVGDETVITLRARITDDAEASRRLAVALDGRRVDVPAGRARAADPVPPPFALPDLEWTPRDAPERYVVQVGRLFDGITGAYEHHVDIHVAGRRIEAIAARGSRPLPDRVVDLRDATVIPGLVDTHVHHSDLLGERLGRSWLAYGVTTVREVTNDVGDALARAEAWASGRRPGPRVVVAPAPGAAAPRRPLAAASPVRVEQAQALTDSLAHSVAQPGGSALPDIVVDGGAAAPRVGGTGNAPVLPVSALGRSYQDAESAVTASGRYVATGLAALAAGAGAGSPAGDAALARLWTAAERARWSGGTDAGTLVEPLRDTVARLVRRGVRVGVGSDAPLTPYGLGLHFELEQLEAAGIPPDQVLRLATAQAALALGLDRELGTLEPGKLADFVVVDGDPLARIGDARRVRAVVVGGVWHERERLLTGPE